MGERVPLPPPPPRSPCDGAGSGAGRLARATLLRIAGWTLAPKMFVGGLLRCAEGAEEEESLMSMVETALFLPTDAAFDRATPSLSREAWLLEERDAGRPPLLASEANARNLPAVPPLLEACCLEDRGTAMDSCCSSVLRSLVRLRRAATGAAGITAPLAASINSLAIPGRPTRVRMPCLPPTPALLLLLPLLPLKSIGPLLGGR